MKHFPLFLVAMLLLFMACGSAKVVSPVAEQDRLTDSELRLIDTILQYGLENEALFTLMADIKPMSSLRLFSFPVANTDSVKRISGDALNRAEHGKYLDRMRRYQRVINHIDLPDLRFVLVPYLSPQGNRRLMQLSVVRVSVLDSLLNAKENFFGQFGLVPGSDPYVVLTAIEGNDSYARWRGYGYLFGYPDYAVDFYNMASHEHKTSGKFVERNFFRIPVYNSSHGSNFAYAYPKDHALTAEVDSALYFRAGKVLEKYKSIRNNYLNPDSTVQAYKLLKDYFRK